MLTTSRLLLRSVSYADEGLLLDLDSDPAVMAYLTGGQAASRSSVRGRLDSWLTHAASHPGFGCFSAWSPSFVGWFSLMYTAPATASLGYRLVRTAWGHGFATEGGQAMIAHGWSLGLSVITAQTMAINLRSRRVMESLGMSLTRTWREEFDDPIPGTEYGEVEYSLALSRDPGRHAPAAPDATVALNDLVLRPLSDELLG